MKYSEAKMGRVFVLRLEHGEILHAVIEQFAREKKIRAAALIVVGAADKDSTLVVGPASRIRRPVIPMQRLLDNASEITGTGTLFPDESGQPILHMHVAAGRGTQTVTGCVRKGVMIWQVAEVILYELLDTPAVRRLEPEIGFTLLQPGG